MAMDAAMGIGFGLSPRRLRLLAVAVAARARTSKATEAMDRMVLGVAIGTGE